MLYHIGRPIDQTANEKGHHLWQPFSSLFFCSFVSNQGIITCTFIVLVALANHHISRITPSKNLINPFPNVPIPFYLNLRFSRRILSEINAMHSELVGFPFPAFTVYPNNSSMVSSRPLVHATSMAWRMARSTRLAVV